MHGFQSAGHVDASDKVRGLFFLRIDRAGEPLSLKFPKEPLEPK